MNNKKSIPQQRSGASSDTAARIRMKSETAVAAHFKTVKSRLLDVSNWKETSASLSAEFQLTDNAGKEVRRPAQKGDYFKINLPAPGTQAGSGFDWVMIEEIQDESDSGSTEEMLAIKVRPAPSPQNNEKSTAHFFKRNATSTFLVRRAGLIISAEVHGRNEEPNTEVKSLKDRIRNFFVAIGAVLGFSKLQWKGLVEGLVKFSPS